MTTRYRLTYQGSRGGMFYCLDKTTGQRTSLKTTGKEEVQQIIDAKIGRDFTEDVSPVKLEV